MFVSPRKKWKHRGLVWVASAYNSDPFIDIRLFFLLFLSLLVRPSAHQSNNLFLCLVGLTFPAPKWVTSLKIKHGEKGKKTTHRLCVCVWWERERAIECVCVGVCVSESGTVGREQEERRSVNVQLENPPPQKKTFRPGFYHLQFKMSYFSLCYARWCRFIWFDKSHVKNLKA